MRKTILLLTTCILTLLAKAQPSRHIIELKDKKGTAFSLQQPGLFLSPKAIARRVRYNISIDSTDLPVSQVYLDSIRSAGSVTILNTSKWLNTVLIQTTDPVALAKINSFPFVKQASPVANRAFSVQHPIEKFNEALTDLPQVVNQPQTITEDFYQYGSMGNQVRIHEGEYLHNLGFRGEGMTVAVLDAGFLAYLTSPAFDSIRLQGRILGTWDFVKNETSVNEDNSHGMLCFSVMAANRPGSTVGTAPQASYYLFRSEDAFSEFPVEEQNWAAAAERADSLGVDLITSSLGYYQFDDPAYNHVYADMNGDKTMVTRAADMAARKGIIVTNSAGNSGGSAWKYLIAPADGDSVLAVGAVNNSKQVAPFSSFGPSADGRIKPDVASVGWGTVVTTTAGNPAGANGTSFSNPNLAGLITCLWQAFPEFNNMEILDAVRKSSDKYTNPDDRTGYGIPNMRIAYDILQQEKVKRQAQKVLGDEPIKAYPVPFKDALKILYKARGNAYLHLTLIDAAGRIIAYKKELTTTGQYYYVDFDGLGSLPSGVYFIRYEDSNGKGTISVVK
jgi:hypothetical protein